MKFFAKKTDGRVKYDNPVRVKEYIDQLKDGQEVQVEIKIKRKFRSVSQNSLYWYWLGVISDDTGYTTDELHGTFKSMFLTDHTRQIPLVRSTTALDTAEFTIYLSKIEDTCREKLNITLPNPADLYL
jgi:hypothetical protein